MIAPWGWVASTAQKKSAFLAEHVAPRNRFWDPSKFEHGDPKINQTRFARHLGQKGHWELLGLRCSWDKGLVGQSGPLWAEWPKGLWGDGMGAFGAHGANGAFGGYSEAIPSGWCLTSGGNRFEKYCGT